MKRIDKPWGHELLFVHTDRYAGKLLIIEAGQRLSLQYHEKKDEAFYLQDGKLKFTMECDAFVVAIGTSPNPLIAACNPEIDTEKWGGLIVDEETGETSKERVYAAGDIVTGSATVIAAAGDGKKVAAAIHKRLSEN